MRAGASSPPAPELTLCELRQGWLCAKWRLHGDAEATGYVVSWKRLDWWLGKTSQVSTPQCELSLGDESSAPVAVRVYATHGRKAGPWSATCIARATPMFSGAELAALVNEAAIIAVLRDQDAVQECDLEEARDKILWGR